MAYQIGGRVVIPDLNLPPPEDGAHALHPSAAAKAVDDRISLLPEKARLRILSFLPFKAVVAIGTVSKSWRNLVDDQRRWRDSTLRIHVLSAGAAARGRCGCGRAHLTYDHMPCLARKLRARGRGPSHRLLRFSIVVEDVEMSSAALKSLLDYAAACNVEDVFVDARVRRGPPHGHGLSYSFQRTSNHLVCLTLSGVRIDGIHRPLQLHHQQGSSLIPTLEVIRIGFTELSDVDLSTMLFWCPRLRVLDLRSCRDITRVDVVEASACLMSLTVVDCREVDDIRAETALGLRSFRYRGEVLMSMALPHTCFGDLYISFTGRRAGRPIIGWLEALPYLSNLTVLTICSNALGVCACLQPFTSLVTLAILFYDEIPFLDMSLTEEFRCCSCSALLQIVSALRARENSHPQLAKLSNLQNLRELQLLLYGTEPDILSHVYGFFMNCRCSQLRKLFVQLPKVRTDYVVAVVNELGAEPPMDNFENLVRVKITNFKGQCNEIELVRFLLRKASSLQKLILVAAHAEGYKSAPKNAKVVMLSNPSSAEIWAHHRDLSFEYL
ncbi:hypothetical protein HU200_059265 [Digitaria exilis]|uniref:F-box domain-containing protein n=1 Tax=Digitaria exilis TaxID=1010633 RepID=A0A835E027_9POAL|nr:hypothetical protein HU200_059265 [Digitaria exilis]